MFDGDQFLNRARELERLAEAVANGGFGYVTGRRRIGKTALLVEASRKHGGFYHQAIEGAVQQQLEHLAGELGARLPLFQKVVPRSWSEFFELLSKETLPPLFVLDEFPYLVEADPSLPSILQKWIDHSPASKKCLFLVSGSCQSMLYDQIFSDTAPLYGRSILHLHLVPFTYQWFCKALRYDVADPQSFERFSLVGGVPHYWKLLPRKPLLVQADSLYFEPSALLSEEPRMMLHDEGIWGTIPKAILDLVGRGVTKPGEVASRLGIPQGNLSRPLTLLMDLHFIEKDLPFGESSRTTKRVLYRIFDAALSFFYGTYLPHRHRPLSQKEKSTLIHEHASRQWELFCRRCFPGSGRYWEAEIEIDLIWPQGKKHIVAECKWKKITPAEEKTLLGELQKKFEVSALFPKLQNVEYRILSMKDLAALAKQEVPA